MNEYLILGGGIAGLSAAMTVRSLSSEAQITIVSAENENPYLRPVLSKIDLRRFRRQNITLIEDSMLESSGINMLKGVSAEKLDCKNHLVKLSDGSEHSYDKCIYALGADCFVPPFPGREKKGVFTLRNTNDLHKIRRYAAAAKNAVLIGGGIIGFEMAWELKKLGISCTILEAAPRLMGRQLDEESSAVLADHIKGLGIVCRTGCRISEITGGDSVTGAALDDGSFYPADLVLISCGVRPVVDPAAAGGIKCSAGVLTDDTLKTSDEDVYAAGDCIMCGSPNPGLWKYARISGEIAGHNAVFPEEPLSFSCGSFPVVLNAMNISLFSAGNVSGGENIRTVVSRGTGSKSNVFAVNEHELCELRYRKLFYKNDRLCGAVVIGDVSDMYELLEELEGGK